MLKKITHPQRNDFAELFGPGDVPGYLTSGDIDAICQLSKKLPSNNGILIEVGAFLGKSATEWAKNLNEDYNIICIDSFNSPKEVLDDLLIHADFVVPENCPTQLDMFRHYTSKYSAITPVTAFFNADFVFPAKADLVFEDSTHEQKYLSYALPFWWNSIRIGGILSGHDYTLRPVQQAVDLFAALNKLTVKTFDQSSIWYIEKN